MDILTEAIGRMRIGRARARLVKESGSWGLRYAASEASGFHIVMRGNGWLITPADEPRELTPGDVVLVVGL
jgi:Cupin